MYPRTTNLPYILLLHLLGLPAAYFLTSFLSNFYPQPHQFVLLSLFIQLVCGVLSVLFFDARLAELIQNWREHWMSLFTFLVVASLPIAAVVISWQFPGLFNRRVIFMDTAMMPLFLSMTLVSTAGTVTLTKWMERKGLNLAFRATSLFQFVQAHLAGILLSMVFFFTYFVLAQTLNFPGHNTLDLNFDTDGSQWIARLTARAKDDFPFVRAVHPAVMLFLHPLVWLISLPLNGDRLQAAFMLNAMAGAGCVLLTWVIVKRISNTTFALIMASLLGVSTSHLLLGSILETYIFSSLVLIAFVLLLQADRTSLKSTVPVGILIFGITITNLAQACILYFLKLPRPRLIITFVLAVVASALVLNVVQVGVFPSAQPLYNPDSLTVEKNYRFRLFDAPWRFTGRMNLISRAILLYGVVAPEPFVLTQELGTDLPNFRTFKITTGRLNVAGYKGVGDAAVKTWTAILAVAVTLAIMNFRKSPKQEILSLGLVLCLGFSFILHTLYGDDPMLYSPNWVYALLLFVAFSFRKWADNRWLQAVFVVFLGMVIYNNLELIHQIMTVSLPFYGR
jgi:hypothetical protein